MSNLEKDPAEVLLADPVPGVAASGGGVEVLEPIGHGVQNPGAMGGSVLLTDDGSALPAPELPNVRLRPRE